MKRLLFIVLLLAGCATPTCPVCPKEDMVVFIQPFNIPMVVPKGFLSDKDAVTRKQFEADLKEEMKRRGKAI